MPCSSVSIFDFEQVNTGWVNVSIEIYLYWYCKNQGLNMQYVAAYTNTLLNGLLYIQ